MEPINNLLLEHGIEGGLAWNLSIIISVIMIVLAGLAAAAAFNLIVNKILKPYIMKNRFEWDDVLLKRRVFNRIFYLIPAIFFASAAHFFHPYEEVVKKGASVYIIVLAVFIVNAVLDSLDDIYRTLPISKTRPIKGFLQVVKLVAYILAGIVVAAILLDKSPLILLSGVGALTAVISLVFKDSILGFVAGIQLTANDMLRIGDWIEMSKYGANGEITEISLNTVKVKNFDNTIVTIPAYALVSDSFKNWRGMQVSGGRRIMRSINIDMTGIRICSAEMLRKFKQIHYLSDYITTKEEEIARYNAEHDIDASLSINGRQMTNIGVFRIYIEEYLRHHPRVHQGMTLMVRQLPPAEHGLPIEIYAFTDDTNWIHYEKVQADIFDHILAAVGEFDLRIYQAPTGYDFQR